MSAKAVMSTHQASEYLETCGVTRKFRTLQKLRITGKGPSFLKIGGSIFYRAEDLDAWINNAPAFTSTSDMDARRSR